MEKIFKLSFFLAVFTSAYGQEIVNNFHVDNSEIIWQQVYETSMTLGVLTGKVKGSGLLEKVEVGENKISGELKAIDADFRGAGFTEMGTSMYIARSHFTGFTILGIYMR